MSVILCIFVLFFIKLQLYAIFYAVYSLSPVSIQTLISKIKMLLALINRSIVSGTRSYSLSSMAVQPSNSKFFSYKLTNSTDNLKNYLFFGLFNHESEAIGIKFQINQILLDLVFYKPDIECDIPRKNNHQAIIQFMLIFSLSKLTKSLNLLPIIKYFTLQYNLYSPFYLTIADIHFRSLSNGIQYYNYISV